jgi:hypothetical protein
VNEDIPIVQQEEPEKEPKEIPVPIQQNEPGLRRFPGPKALRATSGHRRIKMARPVCDIAKMRALGLPDQDCCMDAEKRTHRWWLDCPHNPYFTMEKRTESLPEFGPPNERGEREIIRTQSRTYYIERPNLVQVSLTRRHHWANGPQVMRNERGYRFTHEIGIAPYCEYSDCWSHDLKYQTKYGNFCDPTQAQIVAADYRQKTLEVGAPNLPGSMEKRESQLQDALPL